MVISYKQLIKKYQLDNFQIGLELKSHEKLDFFNELDNILKTMCKIIDKLTSIASLRGGQVLMSLAKLQTPGNVVNKTDVKNCLNIDRLEKLIHAFNYLQHQNYIKIDRKTKKFHIIRLNIDDNPDFKLFQEVIQKFWISPEEEKEKIRKWAD
jgi:arginine utilization protein RocB